MKIRNQLIGLLLVAFVSCSGIDPAWPECGFNVRLRYGVLARNEVNTFQNTFTKDLILDGTVTVPFHLTQADLDSIESMMNRIGFFNYPDTFVVRTQDSIKRVIAPYNTYDFSVATHDRSKTLHWGDFIISSDTQAGNLRELIFLIRRVVETKPEYERLPATRGGYL